MEQKNLDDKKVSSITSENKTPKSSYPLIWGQSTFKFEDERRLLEIRNILGWNLKKSFKNVVLKA